MRPLCFLVLLSACTPNTTDAPFTRIAFQSARDGQNEIYALKLRLTPDHRVEAALENPTNLQRLTNNPAQDEQPAQAHGGSKVIFRSDRSGEHALWELDDEGGWAVPRLTPDTMEASSARWSPDNDFVVFSATAQNTVSPDIYRMDPDGRRIQRLTRDGANDIEPCVSPDETKIAFTSTRAQQSDVYLMNTDGTEVERLTDDIHCDAEPSFSPDGKHIAFWSYRDGNGEIYVMNADGSDQRNISQSPGSEEFEPLFSPYADEIVFSSNRSGNWDIYVMNADGSNVRQLTDNAADDRAPDWR